MPAQHNPPPSARTDVQAGTTEDDAFNDAALVSTAPVSTNNSTSRPLEGEPTATTGVILAGFTWGDWAAVSAGEGDFAVAALRLDGEELWRWQV